MGRTFHTCPRFSFTLVIGLVVNVIIGLLTFMGLINAWVDFTLSGVRLGAFIASGVIAIIAIVLLLYKSNEVRRIHLESRIPAMEFDVELAGYWWATTIFVVLTLLLGILHFKYTSSPASPSDFDPILQPSLNARLYMVMLAYLMFAIIWIGVVFYNGIKSRLAEERRKYGKDTEGINV